MPTGRSSEAITRLCEDHYNARVISLRRIHNDLMIVKVGPDHGPVRFHPGQYTLLGLGVWESRVDQIPIHEDNSKLVRRAYSISCPMLDERQELVKATELSYLEFYV